jgi:hypothetical protein
LLQIKRCGFQVVRGEKSKRSVAMHLDTVHS